jgi:transcriptional regulator with XRE-family HTH domain
MVTEDWNIALRRFRERLTLSRTELAYLTHISPETLRAYEAGRRRPSRQALNAILAALRLDRLQANGIRHLLGFAADYLQLDQREPTYMFSLPELQEEVERIPWPEFVVDENLQVVVANRVTQKLWDVDLEREFPTIQERNMLRVATGQRFGQRLVNWEETVALAVAVWKGHHPDAESLELSSPPYRRVVEELMGGNPDRVRRFIDVWDRTPGWSPKVRVRYPVVWRDPAYGEMRFVGLATTANQWEGLLFDDWHPVDAETWQRLEALKAGRQLSPDSGA